MLARWEHLSQQFGALDTAQKGWQQWVQNFANDCKKALQDKDEKLVYLDKRLNFLQGLESWDDRVNGDTAKAKGDMGELNRKLQQCFRLLDDERLERLCEQNDLFEKLTEKIEAVDNHTPPLWISRG